MGVHTVVCPGRKYQCLRQRSSYAAITTDDGLSNSNVSDIVQDRNGFVWIATSNGLNRFDGSNFKTILQGNQIRCIYEDRSGKVWICDKRGLTRLTYLPDGNVHEENLTSRLYDRSVRTLFEDSRGNVWIGYGNDCITMYRPSTNQFQNFTLKLENEGGTPSFLVVAPYGVHLQSVLISKPLQSHCLCGWSADAKQPASPSPPTA